MAGTILNFNKVKHSNKAIVVKDDSITQLLNQVKEQEKKLLSLQQKLLEERYAKEGLLSDLEHVLSQLKVLQKGNMFSNQTDIAYL